MSDTTTRPGRLMPCLWFIDRLIMAGFQQTTASWAMEQMTDEATDDMTDEQREEARGQ